MGAYKQISPQDTFITTYVSHKEWEITGSSYSTYGVSSAYIDRYDSSAYYLNPSDEYSGSYKPLYFKSLDHLYYRSFNNSASLSSAIGIVSSSYEHYLQTSLIQPNVRHISDEVLVISIPRVITGTGIEPGAVTIQLPTIDLEDLYVDTGYLIQGYFRELLGTLDLSEGIISDSTEGTLVIRTGTGEYVRAGDIHYLHGIIVITHPELISAYKADGLVPTLKFRSTKEIYTYNTHCTVLAEDLNFTLNPTTTVSGSIGDIKSDLLQDEFNPYITTVGLYNASNELIAVGKLSQPIPKSDQTDMVFVVKVSIDNSYVE
jgi:hypothetical protein